MVLTTPTSHVGRVIMRFVPPAVIAVIIDRPVGLTGNDEAFAVPTLHAARVFSPDFSGRHRGSRGRLVDAVVV